MKIWQKSKENWNIMWATYVQPKQNSPKAQKGQTCIVRNPLLRWKHLKMRRTWRSNWEECKKMTVRRWFSKDLLEIEGLVRSATKISRDNKSIFQHWSDRISPDDLNNIALKFLITSISRFYSATQNVRMKSSPTEKRILTLPTSSKTLQSPDNTTFLHKVDKQC